MSFELSGEGVEAVGTGTRASTSAMKLEEHRGAHTEGDGGLGLPQEQLDTTVTHFRDPGHGGAWVLRAAGADGRLETAYLLPRVS